MKKGPTDDYRPGPFIERRAETAEIQRQTAELRKRRMEERGAGGERDYNLHQELN